MNASCTQSSAYESVAPKLSIRNVLVKVSAKSQISKQDILSSVLRHSDGDWGEISERERLTNEEAFVTGGVVRSIFYTLRGVKFKIETDLGERSTQIELA